MLETLVEKTKIDVPEYLVAYELEMMLGQFKSEVERAGVKWEDYLTHIKKTDDDIRKEWKDAALTRIKAGLVISKIAETEKLESNNLRVLEFLESIQ